MPKFICNECGEEYEDEDDFGFCEHCDNELDDTEDEE